MSVTGYQPMNTIKPKMPVGTNNAFAVTDIRRRDHEDGSILLQNNIALPSPLPDIIDRLDHWTALSGDTLLITEPDHDDRRNLSYRDAARSSIELANFLIMHGCKSGDVVCVVAGASCEHGLIKLACLRAGLIHAPLSPTLVERNSGKSKIAAMIAICKPVLILADETCLDQLSQLEGSESVEIISIAQLVADASSTQAPPLPASLTEQTFSPDQIAAIYFTSGSTGSPKGVLVTRRMISAVQAAITCHWPFFTYQKPVIADWLPWHHVFGGLDNFFKMVWNGGTYHIRETPTRATIEKTAKFIADVQPTIYIDVPFGIKLLLDYLENNEEVRAKFFSRLELIFFAGAGMDAETWSRLNRILLQSNDFVRPSLRLASGYGSTESGSTICLAHEEPGSPGEIGVPLPGHTLSLVDVDGHMEIRVRGPNVSPGYIDADGPVSMPLDEQCFLRTGDIAAAVRPFHPELGLRFDGRLAEDFKLTNGTRVRVGALRQMLLASCAPYLSDVAITGETHDYLCAILFPSPATDDLDKESCAKYFEKVLVEHNAQWPNSSMAIRRAILTGSPPDPDAGEINDKGHLVQRKCLQNRKGEVARLYAKRPDDMIIVPAMPKN